jgi:hypothetical protein
MIPTNKDDGWKVTENESNRLSLSDLSSTVNGDV